MEKLSIKSMNIEVSLHDNVISILGPSNSGKTYLLKKLINILPNDDVFLDDVLISSYDITYLKNNIAVCLDDGVFKCEYVAEELYFYLDKLGLSIEDITDKINNIASIFKIKNILNKRIDLLPLNKRILIKILSLLIMEPKIFGIDNILNYLTNEDKKIFLKYIKEKDIILINTTNSGEDILISDKILVINDKKCIYYGERKELLNGNTILPYMGIELPFIADLCQNLVLYGIINKVYLDDKKLVSKIWK